MGAKLLGIFGIIEFILGALVAGSFGLMAVWANFEASLFDVSLSAEEPLSTLRCSAIVTHSGTSMFSAAFNNPLERPLRRRVSIRVTDGYITLMRELEQSVLLEPGETRRLAWPVSPSDVVWDRFVLVRVYVNRIYPMPSLTGSCGMIYVPISGIGGDQLAAWLVWGSLLAMGLGLGVRILSTRPLSGEARGQSFTMAGVLALLAIIHIALYMGWWIASGVLLALAALGLVALGSRSMASIQ